MQNKEVQRHHVYIKQQLTGSTFVKSIHVPFNPDEVVVRNVTFHMSDPYYGVWSIRTNVLASDLCIISDECMYSPLTVIPISKSVSTLWRFEVVDDDGHIVQLVDPSGNDVDFNGHLGVTLEFIKYN